MLHGVHDMYVQVMGINVQPLLAVGGVSGIAIGFGAQSVSANAITGINLVSAVVCSLSGRPKPSVAMSSMDIWSAFTFPVPPLPKPLSSVVALHIVALHCIGNRLHKSIWRHMHHGMMMTQCMVYGKISRQDRMSPVTVFT